MFRQAAFFSLADSRPGNPADEFASKVSWSARWNVNLSNGRLQELERIASRIRRQFKVYLEPKVDILRVVELKFSTFYPDFRFVVIDDDDQVFAKNILAFTQFDPLQIGVREAIYRLAANDDPRARFVLAHEFGHLILHDLDLGAKLFAGARSDFEALEIRFELEANIFAAAFLIPAWKTNCMSAEQISASFGVTRALAEWRLKQVGALRAKGPAMRGGCSSQ
ncbi:MAG TPA: ImmA/IrrE family metallo-endopeptidase [Xanthobacteraceae bacterium]|nr:ImmA/IrrE family metallo-endopeptidase [Xanthobacteraceae bacterium]